MTTRRWFTAAAAAIVALSVAIGVRQQQDAARRSQSRNNLKQIELALYNDHGTYDLFPPGMTLGENGQPVCRDDRPNSPVGQSTERARFSKINPCLPCPRGYTDN